MAATRSRTIGFIFQFFLLIPRLTAQQNIELPLLLAGVPQRERRERSRPLIEANARAVINRPAILLADEPTGNLGRHAGGEIIDLLEGLHRDGLTLVVVTHDPEIGERAARRIRVVDGRIADDSGGP